MAGDTMERMPMSPRQSPGELGNAAMAWVRSRRGRTLAISAVFVMVVLLGLTGARHSETISSGYQALSSNYHLPSWRPSLPNLPSIISTPLKPSNTTLELENGDKKHVPSQLKKSSPNFHLLMNSLQDSPEFCKTTMSAMILNYPPPTIINLHQKFDSQAEREKSRLKSIDEYLQNQKLVKDEDLVLVVDGQDTWFQLPSDVIIRQYQNVVADANKRLLDKYGQDADKKQKFNQTIVFGAEKRCEGEDLSCRHVPESMLPKDIYGKDTGKEIATTPAKYLDAGMMIGPAKDLRALFEAAVKNFDAQNSQSATTQSVLSTMFGEQQLARNAALASSKPAHTKWFSWFGGSLATTSEEDVEAPANITLQEGQQYEFSIGIDYTHMLFQPFIYAAEDELVPLRHGATIDLSAYQRADTPAPPLTIPTALQQAKPPFWTPDLSKQNPSPNAKPSFIEPLQIRKDLDDLKPRDTAWDTLELVQNTYTGAIPAIFHLNLLEKPPNTREADALTSRSPRYPDSRAHTAPMANLTWSSLWFSGYERALLRQYLRTPQSPIGYHTAAVGGDQMWDQRGGRGGVWTVQGEMWLPWGEVDGVCGTLEQLKHIFTDKKGLWLHESEAQNKAEEDRRKEEEELKKKIAEQKQKDAEARKKAEEEAKAKKLAEELAKVEEDKKKLKVDEEKKQKEEDEQKQNEQKEMERKKQEDLDKLKTDKLAELEEEAKQQADADRKKEAAKLVEEAKEQKEKKKQGQRHRRSRTWMA